MTSLYTLNNAVSVLWWALTHLLDGDKLFMHHEGTV